VVVNALFFAQTLDKVAGRSPCRTGAVVSRLGVFLLKLEAIGVGLDLPWVVEDADN